MTVSQATEKLLELQKKLTAYNHACGMLYFDGVTVAPKDTSDARGETLAILGEASYILSTGEETGALLDFLTEHESELDEKTRRIVYLMNKELRELRSIPMNEYIEYQKLINDAQAVWHNAKEENNYDMFEPYLSKIVETHLRFAALMDPAKHPYDVWLDKYEPGLNMEKCEAFFSVLREKLVPLIKKIGEKPQLSDSIIHGSFPVEAQKKLSDRLMEIMCIDRNHCGIGETEHPFTINFTKHDVRITTKYHEDDFSDSMFSVIHEGGHALYELNTGDDYAFTCIGTGVSMGIHESQSRFFENLIGRSEAFCQLLFPELQELFGLEGYTARDFYCAVNRAQPSLIRIAADELTYSMHIMVRYEIEKMLMNGEVTTKELPATWNRLYKEYLGVDVPSDKEGVLQDSHWSGGSIGYFPSYALGSAYGAQFIAKMREELDVDECIRKGDLAPVNAWLEEKIWRHGSMYEPADLLDMVLGVPFDPTYYTDYLTKKFTELYNL